jgi:hypothetical protein
VGCGGGWGVRAGDRRGRASCCYPCTRLLHWSRPSWRSPCSLSFPPLALASGIQAQDARGIWAFPIGPHALFVSCPFIHPLLTHTPVNLSCTYIYICSNIYLLTSDDFPLSSDFPYVCTLGGGYKEAPRAILAWKAAGLLPSLTETDYENLFSGTYCRVFGVTGREG